MSTPRDGPAGRSSEQPGPDASDRLDSWKEIAAFLKRDVRTAQRWEKRAGLPVHRHLRSQLRTAYAYRSELDAWWRRYRATGESSTAHTGPLDRRAKRQRSAGALAGGSLVALASVALWLLWMRPDGQTVMTPPTVVSAIPVLIADVDNQTGRPTLTSLVREEVVRQLTQHEEVEIVPPARIATLLQRMKRDQATTINKEIARELAVRDGRIRFLVVARVHQGDAKYYVDLELIDPAEGRVRVSVEGRAAAQEQLAASVRRETDQLTRRLLEEAAARPHSGARFEEVSTRSLPAVQLYSEAVQAGDREQWGTSELLTRRALMADPEFASGYAWLAWALRNQGRAARDCLTFARRASELSSGSSAHEVTFISGTQFEMAGDLAKALEAYEAMLRLEPGNPRTLELLVNGYARMGRFRAAVDHAVARVKVQRDDFYANVRAAHALTIWQSDRRRAEPFVERARSLLPTIRPGERLEWKTWLLLLPVFDRWLADDRAAAREALASLQAALDEAIGRERDMLASALGSGYLALGMLEAAERTFISAAAPVRQIGLAMLALTVGDKARARDALLQIDGSASVRPALFAAAGLLREAEAGLLSSFGSDYGEGIEAVTRGLIAARRRDTAEAARWLRSGVDLLRSSGQPEYFLGVEALARLWIAAGDHERAGRLLEDAVQQRTRTYGSIWWAGANWTRTSAQLLALSERRGRRGIPECGT